VIANSQRPDRDTIFVLEPDLMIAIADIGCQRLQAVARLR